ncbi:MAG TPA: sel1 repeat family protein, partial [Gammaproteobacteria bacterium]|nr:sel1 repeat family protein [Gammaproteobacteria bacterium]
MKKLITTVLLALLIPATSFGASEEDKRWFEETQVEANQGDADAQYLLGLMYANGRGVPQDDKEAVRWYRLAADQ